MKTAKLFLEYFPEFLISSENLPFDLILSCFQLRYVYGYIRELFLYFLGEKVALRLCVRTEM